MSELISIVTPFQNEEFFLKDCYDSIRDQTHQDFQWILVDDHSDDRSWQMANEMALEDERILVMKNRGEGIVDALVTAQEACKGDWLTRMDADDVMTPDKLEVLLGILQQNPDSDVSTACVKYFSRSEQISEGYIRYENWLNRTVRNSDFMAQLYRECPVCSSNWMIAMKDHLRAGGFQGLPYPEDYALVFRWIKAGLRIQGSPVITHMWREYPERTSRTTSEYSQESFFSLKTRIFVKRVLTEQSTIHLLGVNSKSSMFRQYVGKGYQIIPYDLDPARFQTKVHDIRDLPSAQQGHVVVSCVHPNKKQKKLLREFITEQGFIEGENFWFF